MPENNEVSIEMTGIHTTGNDNKKFDNPLNDSNACMNPLSNKKKSRNKNWSKVRLAVKATSTMKAPRKERIAQVVKTKKRLSRKRMSVESKIVV